jgi:beta-glucosidase
VTANDARPVATELFHDPTVPLDRRVDDLLSRMTLREKAGQLNQRLWGWRMWRRDGAGFVLAPELDDEIERWGGLGAVYGLLRADAWSGRDWANGADPARAADVVAAVQERVVAGSRFGIPALVTEEAGHGVQALGSRLLPVNVGVGATWRPRLLEEAAAHTAAEARALGVHLALASCLDMLRDPRWGRAEETFGEDPVLAAAFTRALVRGFAAVPGIGVVLKHFAAQGAAVGGRNQSGAPIGARELAEIHLPAARAGIEEGAVGVMAAYNEVDGVPCVAHHGLLTGVLRDEWGFDGIVMSDMFAVDRLLRSAPSGAHAAALALAAGLDMSMSDESFADIERGVADGLIPVEHVDRAARRVLALKIRLGLLDPPAPAPVFSHAPGEHDLVAAGPVLLTNRGGLLPLAPTTRLAVVGPNGDDVPALLGDYVPPLPDRAGVSVLAGLRRTFGEVTFEPGCGLAEPVVGGLERAAAAARAADVVVLALGSTGERAYDDDFAANGAAELTGRRARATTGEGYDVAEVELPAAQRALVDAVAATGTPAVAVVVSGRPLGIARLAEACDAVLYAWYPGPGGGAAVADVLAGHREPLGRLPVSLPATSGTLPVAYDERLESALRYVDAEARPVFGFGAGLGYASFALGAAAVGGAYPDLVVSAPLANTSGCAGSTVVQLYGRARVPGLVPRRAALLGFAEAALAAGASATVAVPLLRDAVPALGDPDRGELDLWLSLDGPGEPVEPLTVPLGRLRADGADGAPRAGSRRER